MKRFALLALGLLAVAPALQAAPVDWSYSWKVTPIAVGTNPAGGSVSLTDALSGVGSGNSAILATNLATNSSAPNDNPNTFPSDSQPYTLELTLTDTETGVSDTFTFTGHFEGTVSVNSANILNFFDSDTTITKEVGNNTYTITIGHYTPPGAPGVGGQGAIGAFVEAKEGREGDDDPPPPSETPEPSTLLLGGMGLSLMGLVYRRRQRA